ncbi:hypothetical protein RHECNPAF_850054 [Rhizobium etli CNPAF512]|nr:hypothetical protein RHECNPAF_850054 [Rhizobium etli CNPAF512]
MAHHLRIALALRHMPPVDHGHADGEFRLDLDLDIAVPAVEKLRLQQIGDHRRIVQRPAVGAVFLDIEAFEEFQHLDHRLGWRRTDLGHALHPVLAGQQLMRHVERHHHDRHARAEDDVGGLRIDIDVELGRRRDVAALEEAAAHHHQFADARDDVGRLLEGHADIGERPERAERHRACRLLAQRLDDEIDGMGRLQRHHRLGERGSVEAGLAVHMLRRHQLAGNRPVGTGEDLRLRPAAKLADDARIAARQRKRHIAGDRRDPQHLQLIGAAEGQHDGGRVVLAGIRVDDDFSCACHDRPVLAMPVAAACTTSSFPVANQHISHGYVLMRGDRRFVKQGDGRRPS